MRQNSIAIFCNVNLSFGQAVMPAQREREREREKEREKEKEQE